MIYSKRHRYEKCLDVFVGHIRDRISKVSIFRIIVDLCEHGREVIHTPAGVYGVGLRQEILEYLCRRRLCKLKEKGPRQYHQRQKDGTGEILCP